MDPSYMLEEERDGPNVTPNIKFAQKTFWRTTVKRWLTFLAQQNIEKQYVISKRCFSRGPFAGKIYWMMMIGGDWRYLRATSRPFPTILKTQPHCRVHTAFKTYLVSSKVFCSIERRGNNKHVEECSTQEKLSSTHRNLNGKWTKKKTMAEDKDSFSKKAVGLFQAYWLQWILSGTKMATWNYEPQVLI